MNRFHMYIPVKNEAIRTAVPLLAQVGISFADSMEDSNIVLYPVPTPGELLSDATPAQLVIGGNLDALPAHIRRLDLLKDPVYVAQNAAVTAEAALAILLEHLPCQLADAEILILGWGRIGKCLAQMLRALGACVTVCARNPRDIALLHALGYHAIFPEMLPEQLSAFRCIVNTVPAEVIRADSQIPDRCFLLDLASGVFLPGDHVCSARGLPGKCKPEASGTLIAQAVLRHLQGGKVL